MKVAVFIVLLVLTGIFFLMGPKDDESLVEPIVVPEETRLIEAEILHRAQLEPRVPDIIMPP